MTIDDESADRFAASVRHFGVSADEAAEALSAVHRVPLPPHLEAMLATAVDAVRPGWWMSPAGWAARWRFGRWRAGQRRLDSSGGES